MPQLNPLGVRKIIDAMAAAKQRPSQRRKRMRDVGKQGEAVHIDPARNPDLIVFQRASPEAAYDLFQLLKQVTAARPGASRARDCEPRALRPSSSGH